MDRKARYSSRGAGAASVCAAVCLAFCGGAAFAGDGPELVPPLVCSAATAHDPEVSKFCTVTPLANGHNEIKVSLTAESSTVSVGGYVVKTENYNGAYLTPVIEAMPGDTVAAHLENHLEPRMHAGMVHGDADENPTNLHYFHGGIVSPNNAWPMSAELGTGDNVYVHLKAGNSFDYSVPIPGPTELDARVLEAEAAGAFIPHPLGLNWYHSHMHGISSDQVIGGMSGLLSVGEATANVKAGCLPDPDHAGQCRNDVAEDTDTLRKNTDVRYALLRDIPLKEIGSTLPEDASNTPATWAPEAQTFKSGSSCGVWKKDGTEDTSDVSLRKGFCQRSQDTAWLFPLNGQRFPIMTVKGSENLLLRLGNLSANVAYWLELKSEADGKVLPLTVISVDGVVPARPVAPDQASIPVLASNFPSLLLMPASRVEVYVRNDTEEHGEPRFYVLRARQMNAGSDVWPEIQLARIKLEPNAQVSEIPVALNAPVESVLSAVTAGAAPSGPPQHSPGCVRDLDPSQLEYRRISFQTNGAAGWKSMAEIIRPSSETKEEVKHKPFDPEETVPSVPFEEFLGPDDLVDWSMKHVCIHLDHVGSHKQLWVLFNRTGALHNFHIHQMKFRLATKQELLDHHIMPPVPSSTCPSGPQNCPEPGYDFYAEDAPSPDPNKADLLWHDTIPMPPLQRVFIVMSFDAEQQIGRFVFHCHILKHEDAGLMAPIEVWGDTAIAAAQ